MCVYVCVLWKVCIHMYVIYVCMYVHVYVCMYVHETFPIFAARMYVCIYIYVYVCFCVCVRVLTHMNTFLSEPLLCVHVYL
jgi:hypothetical protein